MGAYTNIDETGAGLHIGKSATDKLGLYGVTPVVQPANADQAALTDNSGGSADNTIAAVTAAGTITDNGGGTDPGDDTIAAITGDDTVKHAVAQLAAKMNTTSTAITACMNNFADLTAKVNTLRQDLIDVGVIKGAA